MPVRIRRTSSTADHACPRCRRAVDIGPDGRCPLGHRVRPGEPSRASSVTTPRPWGEAQPTPAAALVEAAFRPGIHDELTPQPPAVMATATSADASRAAAAQRRPASLAAVAHPEERAPLTVRSGGPELADVVVARLCPPVLASALDTIPAPPTRAQLPHAAPVRPVLIDEVGGEARRRVVAAGLVAGVAAAFGGSVALAI